MRKLMEVCALILLSLLYESGFEWQKMNYINGSWHAHMHSTASNIYRLSECMWEVRCTAGQWAKDKGNVHKVKKCRNSWKPQGVSVKANVFHCFHINVSGDFSFMFLLLYFVLFFLLYQRRKQHHQQTKWHMCFVALRFFLSSGCRTFILRIVAVYIGYNMARAAYLNLFDAYCAFSVQPIPWGGGVGAEQNAKEMYVLVLGQFSVPACRTVVCRL